MIIEKLVSIPYHTGTMANQSSDAENESYLVNAALFSNSTLEAANGKLKCSLSQYAKHARLGDGNPEALWQENADVFPHEGAAA